MIWHSFVFAFAACSTSLVGEGLVFGSRIKHRRCHVCFCSCCLSVSRSLSLSLFLFLFVCLPGLKGCSSCPHASGVLGVRAPAFLSVFFFLCFLFSRHECPTTITESPEIKLHFATWRGGENNGAAGGESDQSRKLLDIFQNKPHE